MYDEQLYLKADSPISRFAKESISPDLLPHALVVNSLKKAVGMCLFSDRESPFICKQCNVRDVENSRLIGHLVTTAVSLSSSKFQVRCDCSR